MSKLGRKSRVGSSITVIAILVLGAAISGIFTIPVSAQAQLGRNWPNTAGDTTASGFSPQTVINKESAQNLEIKWMYPFPNVAARIGGYPVDQQGTVVPPIIIDGIVYQVMNWGLVLALDAKSGKTIWTYDANAKINQTLDEKAGVKILRGINHYHSIQTFDGKMIVPSFPCDYHVVNLLTGKLELLLRYTCANIPGAQGQGWKGVQTAGPVVYEKGRVMVVPACPIHESNAGMRGCFAGYEFDTGKLLWRFFVSPPAGGDPDWAVRVRDKGWIQGIKASTIPIDNLKNDWGKVTQPGPTILGASAGPGWGAWAVDQETGIAYVGTTQPGPDYNATYRPGPNLFSDSILALDSMTGELKWFFQTTTHDLWDLDCSWNVVLSKIGNKKVIHKACKDGLTWTLDAATGEPIWYFNPSISVKYSDWVPFHPETKLDSGPKDRSAIAGADPRDIRTFTRPWQNWPSKDPYWVNPTGTGAVESDITVAYGKVYVATMNNPSYGRVTSVESSLAGGQVSLTPPTQAVRNTTIYALDAATGKMIWSFYIDNVGYRGRLIATGGLVWAASLDGNLYGLDAETGKVLFTRYLGIGLANAPSFGANADGKMLMVMNVGGTYPTWGAAVPGALMAFGLPDKLPEP